MGSITAEIVQISDFTSASDNEGNALDRTELSGIMARLIHECVRHDVLLGENSGISNPDLLRQFAQQGIDMARRGEMPENFEPEGLKDLPFQFARHEMLEARRIAVARRYAVALT